MFPVLCDLDGVVWLANRPIDGSVDAIARLRAAGHRVLFVTNNSSAEVAVQEAALAAIGVPAEGDVLTSAQAAALLVAPGERAIACAGAGVVEALRRQGAIVLDAGDPAAGDGADAVVVGWHRTFDYERLTRATTALLRGARLVGTNDDATYPTPDGPIPGGGSILAAVAIPALIDRQHRSKTHEAHNNLRLMMLSAQDFYRAERVGPDGKPLTPRFPLTTSPTPPRPFCEDGDDGFVPRPEDWQQPGWRELDFAVEGPHRYRYEFVSQGEGPDAIFTARVLGDLDCDGVLSTFERSGYIDERGDIVTGGGPFIQDELE